MARSFADLPPKILFHHANLQGSGHYRILLPARMLRSSGHAVTQSTMQVLDPQHLAALQPDSVVFQYLQFPSQIEAVKRYRREQKGAHLVSELDDAFWHVPDDSVHKASVPADIKERIVAACRLCDSITVSTEPLRRLMRAAVGVQADIRVIPNQIPRQFLNAAIGAAREAREKATPGKVRVGWAGGLGHTGDLRILTEVIERIHDDRITWVFMGMLPPGLNSNNVEFYPPVPFEQYGTALGALGLDIALAPLADNEFNRCKSDLRVLEYGAAGCAVIASDIEPYREHDTDTAFLAGPDPAAWIGMILDLVDDATERSIKAENLHSWVKDRRLMEQHMPAYEAAWLPKGAALFRPGTTTPTGKLVTVGSQVGDLPAYATLADAWHGEPGADLLYVRPGTNVAPVQAAALTLALGKAASAYPLSNDGFFPQPGIFTPMAAETAARLDEAASLADSDPLKQPYPSGPCVLLSAHALARFGLPDEARFGDIEPALMDWGARCGETGHQHLVVPTLYVAASQPSQVPADLAQATTEHSVTWTPPFLTALQHFREADLLAPARENLDLTYHGLNYKHPLPDASYGDWAAIFDTLGPVDREAIEADIESWIGLVPTVSVVMPVYDPALNFLAVAIESVISQVYPFWELCIADDASTDPLVRKVLADYAAQDSRIKLVVRDTNGHICHATNSALTLATGDLVCFLDHDDALAEQALYMLVRESRLHPDAVFIYSDSDKLNEAGERAEPYFVPDFNYELLLAQNYVTHLCAYKRFRVMALGGTQVGMEGSQDWDLTLRYLDSYGTPPYGNGLVRHVPQVLYHWRQSASSTAQNVMNKPYAIEAGRRAVEAHLLRTRQAAIVAPHPLLTLFNLVRFPPPADNPPLVSILIPTKDNAKLLHTCVDSILQRTAYSNYEIVIAYNGDPTPATLKMFARWDKEPRVRKLYSPGPFNFSTINHEMAALANGEYLCLLNDDTEIVEGAWLSDMVGAAARPGVGAVGPKLVYPNGKVQQCGTIYSAKAAPMMSALHAFQGLPFGHPGHFGRAHLPAEFAAVTGACLLVSRAAWDAVSGLDRSFPQDYGDVDFCLRLRTAGYRNLVLAHIVVRHHEGATKQRIADPAAWSRAEQAEQRLRQRHADVVDPFVNPNLGHEPGLDVLRVPAPDKPWSPARRTRSLIVNGSKSDAIAAYRRGEIAFCATLAGHFLSLTYPKIQNASPIDLRETPDAFLEMLGKLGVPRIVFTGIGGGTLGAVGFFTAVSEAGWPVAYVPGRAARGENPYDYIDAVGWQNTWNRFRQSIAEAPPAIQGDADQAAAD